MDEFEQEHNSRYKKMFELLRQGDLRPDAGTQNRSAATAARYLEGDAATRFISRGVSSLKQDAMLPQPIATRSEDAHRGD
ncbi:hypothetical protein [Sulfitobacter geojensis]|uniref:hypothetical protein n=1 Tax=Sulfitobacter geojensis TaxID=1342299 RepID=UPI000468A68A|nr:hypothetical protein [Sulfitobacter geojensis]NYI29799.1 hypothetical protein [Sulfitobacter geojensis]